MNTSSFIPWLIGCQKKSFKALTKLLFALLIVFCVGAIPLKLTSIIVPGVHVAGTGFVVALMSTLFVIPINYCLPLKAINLYSGLLALPLTAYLLPEDLSFSSWLSFSCGFAVFELLSLVITFLVLAIYACLAKRKLKLGFGAKRVPPWFYVFSTDEEDPSYSNTSTP